MKRGVVGAALMLLCMSFGCNSSTDRVAALEKQVADKDAQINVLATSDAAKDKQIADLTTQLANPGRASTLREVKWSTIIESAAKIQKEDGKYAWFYVALEKTDAAGMAAVKDAVAEKGYNIAPTLREDVVKVTSPKEVRSMLTFVGHINITVNTKPLNDDNVAEISAITGVKAVWPACEMYFPMTIGKDNIPGKKLFVDAKVIGLPPEFFEAEGNRLNLKDFSVYDGYGAQVIVPRVMVEYFDRFFRYTEGYNLEYEKALVNSYFRVRLASSSLFNITPSRTETIDVKVVGYTDLIEDMVVIVIPKVVEDWNNRLFAKNQ